MDQETRIVAAARALTSASDDLCIIEANRIKASERYRSALYDMKVAIESTAWGDMKAEELTGAPAVVVEGGR